MKINFKSLLNNELVQGMIIPLLFYWIGGKFFSGFTLCMVTLVYSVCFIGYKAIQDKKLNVFGVITLIMSFVSIIGMLYFQSESFVQYKGIFSSLVMALVFFGSLFGEKSLMQHIVENSPNQFGPNFKQTQLYRSIWRDETLMWAAYNLTMAVIKFVLMHTVNTTLYFGIMYPISQGSFYALLAFSYYYPNVKIRRATLKESENVL